MAEKFFHGSKVRLYGGPAFYRVRPKVSPLVHEGTYEVADVKFSEQTGEQFVRVRLTADKATSLLSDWIESTWLCRADG